MVAANNFKIQIGAMNYGIAIDAIIGLDLLTTCRVVLNLDDYILKSIKF